MCPDMLLPQQLPEAFTRGRRMGTLRNQAGGILLNCNCFGRTFFDLGHLFGKKLQARIGFRLANLHQKNQQRGNRGTARTRCQRHVVPALPRSA